MPTEAQWEFAAKGGNKSKGCTYAGSNTLSEVGWNLNDGRESHPVKQKRPNELGLYDMSGNVYEWVADYFAPYTTSRRQIRATLPISIRHGRLSNVVARFGTTMLFVTPALIATPTMRKD